MYTASGGYRTLVPFFQDPLSKFLLIQVSPIAIIGKQKKENPVKLFS